MSIYVKQNTSIYAIKVNVKPTIKYEETPWR